MAIALVNQGNVDTAADSSSPFVSVITVTSTVAGNCLVLVIAQGAASTSIDISTITDNIGTGTWVFVADQNGAAGEGPPPIDWQSGANTNVSIAYQLNIPAGITTVTITWAAASKINSVGWSQWSGVLTAAAVDVAENGGGSVAATAQTQTTKATTNADDLVICGICGPASTSILQGTCSPASGWTALTGGAMGSTTRSAIYQIFAATQTVGGSWTMGSSVKAGMVMLSFKAAAAGGNVVPALMGQYRERRS